MPVPDSFGRADKYPQRSSNAYCISRSTTSSNSSRVVHSVGQLVPHAGGEEPQMANRR